MSEQKEALKQAIMDEFFGRMRQAYMASGEAVLDPDWLYNDFLPSLSRKEEAALEEVTAEMMHNGLIVKTAGKRPSYRLTPKGAEFICL